MVLTVCESVLRTMLLLRDNILEKLFCFVKPPIYAKERAERAIFDCINDSNVRFIKDIMLLLYRKVCGKRTLIY